MNTSPNSLYTLKARTLKSAALKRKVRDTLSEFLRRIRLERYTAVNGYVRIYPNGEIFIEREFGTLIPDPEYRKTKPYSLTIAYYHENGNPPDPSDAPELHWQQDDEGQYIGNEITIEWKSCSQLNEEELKQLEAQGWFRFILVPDLSPDDDLEEEFPGWEEELRAWVRAQTQDDGDE